MPDALPKPRRIARITCIVSDTLESRVVDGLAKLKLSDVIQENARSVRQRIRNRWGFIPGTVTTLNDTPMTAYQISIPESAAGPVAAFLIEAADLRTPGHGMLYMQTVDEYAHRDCSPPHLPDTAPEHTMLKDLALLTFILSEEGRGQALASVALRLGTGLPIVSRGAGTGLRDRLGLLRITISPEKEIVRLLVPAQDARNLRHMLIEEGRLNRPGGGFLYQTTVAQGVTDPLLRIGRQEHAASMEQLIAAIDDLKQGTSWRKRFDINDLVGTDSPAAHPSAVPFKEIRFDIPDGHTDVFIKAALNVGASGVTTAQTQCIRPGGGGEGGAREAGLLCVPASASQRVCAALYSAAIQNEVGGGWRIHVLDAPAAFSHQKR